MMKIFRYALVVLGLALMSSHAHGQSYVAYDLAATATPNGTGGLSGQYVGNSNFGGTVGMEFDVNSAAIKVTYLGVFDSGRDGFHNTITAYIFNRDTQSIVTSVAFTPTNSAFQVGYHQFVSVGSDLVLSAGHYIIAAGGFSSADPFGAKQTGAFGGNDPAFVSDTFNSGSGNLISSVGDAVFAPNATVGTYPSFSQQGSGPLALNAATFIYSLSVPEPGSVGWLIGLAGLGGSLSYLRFRGRALKKRA